MYCGICRHKFQEASPSVGDDIECPNCHAIGYGTYAEQSDYHIEWHETDKQDK